MKQGYQSINSVDKKEHIIKLAVVKAMKPASLLDLDTCEKLELIMTINKENFQLYEQ